eukprot:Blabericola_migrator_1__2551@NODE_171_length_12111_cov_153_412405_g148_i0_p7_GENE_NODE_171_length_12111_cov_153_412405_g148_i0NODE_171_length_12111_cov_153_412405_g148_i0_p7_ORF_typecomplete_len222_score50_00Ala_racemase_N/PF01168_20/4_9e49_NODE_171_length_12111_cov_153_412405_g148_i01127211937
MESIKRNYTSIIKSIPPVVELVVVSKLHSIDSINYVNDEFGHILFGENYVQEIVNKCQSDSLKPDVKFTFIGHLQRNKVKALIEGCKGKLLRIETVDSIELSDKIQSVCQKANVELEILIQVNTSGEEAKSGLREYDDIKALAQHIITQCPKLKFKGLMTIGSHECPGFVELRDIRHRLESDMSVESLHLSMGMSDDYQRAIQEGSSEVRIGTAILGTRPG